MGFFKSAPVAYTVDSHMNQKNRTNLSTFFSSMLRQPGGSDFMSEISVLDDGFHKFVVVREKKAGPIVAYALLRQHGADAEVEQLYAAQHGKGYGHLALHTAEVVAKQHGAVKLWLDSVPEATAFYDHEGYVSSDGQKYVKNL